MALQGFVSFVEMVDTHCDVVIRIFLMLPGFSALGFVIYMYITQPDGCHKGKQSI